MDKLIARVGLKEAQGRRRIALKQQKEAKGQEIMVAHR